MSTPEVVSSLKATFETNRNWAEWATVVVFFGLLGDIFVLFGFSKDKPKPEIWLTFVCTLVIAAGVYGEYAFGHRAAAAASELQRSSEAQIARAELRAAEANQKAGEANEHASENALKAAGLEKEAARLRERLIKRESRYLLLSERETEKRLVAALKPFAPQIFEVRYCSSLLGSTDEEESATALVLDDGILPKAGWKRTPESPVPANCSGIGIVVFVSPKASSQTIGAASVLKSALKSILLSGVDMATVPAFAKQLPDIVVIQVFAHP